MGGVRLTWGGALLIRLLSCSWGAGWGGVTEDAAKPHEAACSPWLGMFHSGHCFLIKPWLFAGF